MQNDVRFVIQLVGFGSFLWLGLYILTRAETQAVSRLAGATMVMQGCFFFSSALASIQTDPSMAVLLGRLWWWDSVIPASAWFHMTARLLGVPGWRRRRPLVGVFYALAVVMVPLGTFTNLIHDYPRIQLGSDIAAGPYAGPLYPLFTLYVVVCAVAGVANLFVLVRQEGFRATTRSAAAMRSLSVGGLLFLAGATELTLNTMLRATVPFGQASGSLALIAGLGVFGYTVARYNALLTGNDVRRDFADNLSSTVVVWLLYVPAVLLLVGVDEPRHGLLALLLMALVTVSHTLFDAGRAWLDTLFYSRPEQAVLSDMRELEHVLGATPVRVVDATPGLDERAFKRAVRRALTDLQNPTRLATSKLLGLRIVGARAEALEVDDNRLGRAAALKDLLTDLIDALRPAERGIGVTSDAWRFYNCLYYPYVLDTTLSRVPTRLRAVQERRRRDGTAKTDHERVLEWLTTVNENTFYKWQERAAEIIAETIREMEDRAAVVATPAPDADSPAPRARPARPGATSHAGTVPT